MPVHPFRTQLPRIAPSAWLAPDAVLSGDIEVGEEVSFWFHTVARGDVNWIRIGAGSNIQDGSILHVTHERFPLTIGAGVVIGHGAIVHGCTLEDLCLIGIGARVLDGAVVETGAQVGAGAVVPPGMRVPSGMLAVGIPARVARPLRPEEVANIAEIRDRYIRLKEDYRRELGPGF